MKKCKQCHTDYANDHHFVLSGDKTQWVCENCGTMNIYEPGVERILELKKHASNTYKEIAKDVPASESLRPDHYKKGEDTFAWAERKFDLETCLAIAAFNIHKYNDRSKGQDFQDFGKVADYAQWARSLMIKLENQK